MLDYDQEAQRYDATRGGLPRARAAAAAIASLLPYSPVVVVDVGGGTGIVSAEVAGRTSAAVLVCDASPGMLRVASARLPGRVACADASALPLGAGAVDVVVTLWLLHLLVPTQVEQVVAEAARVLRPRGRYLTTVDKSAAQGRRSGPPSDRAALVTAVAAASGLVPAGETTFAGHGQGVGGSPDPVYRMLAFAADGPPE